jgi:hypothetical protein
MHTNLLASLDLRELNPITDPNVVGQFVGSIVA